MTVIAILKVRKTFLDNLSTKPLCLADVNQQVILLMSRYRKCGRLYLRNTNKEPSSWDGAAYQMFKVCCPRCNPFVRYLIVCPITE